MAILWHEMWHEALEEASRQYFGESNVEAMLATLLPLHEMMARSGPTTLKEIAFVQARPPYPLIPNAAAARDDGAQRAHHAQGDRVRAGEPPLSPKP